ncbi:MAG: helix-turn-helix transcriptional regulator [Candidatus Riflebacteria bacterium]|nr:helix-turn-helix transcriptional regulator [Candidatus Riflebacteria bacterium]
MNFAEAIRLLRKGKKLSQKEFGLLVGVSQDAVSTWERGRNAPDLSTLTRIAKVLEIRVKDLVGEGIVINSSPATDATNEILNGEEDIEAELALDDYEFKQLLIKEGREPDKSHLQEAIEKIKEVSKLTGAPVTSFFGIEPPDIHSIRIPIYDNEASAGNGCFNDVDHVTNFLTIDGDVLREDLPGNPEHLVIIRVRGDSMVPSIQPGEMAVVDKTETEITIDGLYVLRYNGTLIIKRLQMIPGGDVNILSDNPVYPPIRLSSKNPPDEFRVAGRVVALVTTRKV